ncbi:mas-related G-protein coupled receptor member X4-like [Sminthopsis crassicaudata]|uniref:mas-related G-protein coupled receptor member X4-like n=1 Tax=Sminthopsis crassicaudata TaxID=9301 RepID=UPI003D696503
MEHGPPNMTGAPTTEYPGYGSDNSTENSESSSGSLGFYYWMRILILVIAPLGLLGNGAVLWLLGFRSRRTPFSVYILNLAAADALFLCSAFLLSIDRFVKYINRLTGSILRFLAFMSYTAGLSLLAAISTERCLSALFPLWYRCHRPKHTSAAVCAGIWALAGMFRVIYFFCNLEFRRIFYAVYFLLLTCVLCVSSLTLLLRVQCCSRRPRPPRLSLLVLLTVLVFLLCGLPLGIWAVLYFHLHIDLIPHWLYEPLACVNSSVNPLIYFFVGRLGHKRREPLRLVLQRALGDEQESGGGTTDSPQPSLGTSFGA